MNILAKFVSLIALAAVVVPCLVYFTGTITLETVKWSAFAGTIAWFIATPLWMDRQLDVAATEVEI